MWMALLPLMQPITCDTADFGGIEIIMCTWSGIRWPSSIRLSFCAAKRRRTSPRYGRSWPNRAFRRPFGMNTTWYLHSHREWLIPGPGSSDLWLTARSRPRRPRAKRSSGQDFPCPVSGRPGRRDHVLLEVWDVGVHPRPHPAPHLGLGAGGAGLAGEADARAPVVKA